MASVMSLLNRLLPFATPGTPLSQDLVHLGIICVLLYYAPQIQDWIQQRRQYSTDTGHNDQLHDQEMPLPAQRNGYEEDQQPQEANNQHAAPRAMPNGHIHEVPAGPENHVEEGDPGPANAPHRDQIPQQRNVGAKKAKSLARKDQRRAYNEFQRSQGDAQRARDAEGAAEREAEQAAERERRKAAEAKLEAKKAQEREKKREQERREREEDFARRERAIEIVREELEERKMCNLFDVARQVGGEDDVWVEKILNASGMLGTRKDGSVTMVTSTGWVVRVRKEDMLKAYSGAAESQKGGKSEISYEYVGKLLEETLRSSWSR